MNTEPECNVITAARANLASMTVAEDETLDLGSAEFASPRLVAARLQDLAGAITEARRRESAPIAAYSDIEFGKRQMIGADIGRLEREMAEFVRALPDRQLAKAIEFMNQVAR